MIAEIYPDYSMDMYVLIARCDSFPAACENATICMDLTWAHVTRMLNASGPEWRKFPYGESWHLSCHDVCMCDKLLTMFTVGLCSGPLLRDSSLLKDFLRLALSGRGCVRGSVDYVERNPKCCYRSLAKMHKFIFSSWSNVTQRRRIETCDNGNRPLSSLISRLHVHVHLILTHYKLTVSQIFPQSFEGVDKKKPWKSCSSLGAWMAL